MAKSLNPGVPSPLAHDGGGESTSPSGRKWGFNPNSEVEQSDLTQSPAREGVLSALTVSKRDASALSQLLSARTFRQLITVNFGVRVESPRWEQQNLPSITRCFVQRFLTPHEHQILEEGLSNPLFGSSVTAN